MTSKGVSGRGLRYLATQQRLEAGGAVVLKIIHSQVVESLQELRTGKGLTEEGLKKHPLLFHLLNVETYSEGVKRLDDFSELIDDKRDCKKAVRNALALGDESGDLLGVRRRNITKAEPGGRAKIQLGTRQLNRIEDEGFEQLAQIIIRQTSSPLAREEESAAPETPSPTIRPGRHNNFQYFGKLEIGLLVLVLLLGMSASGILIRETSLGDSVVDRTLTERFSHLDAKKDNSALTSLAKPPVSLSAEKASQTSESGWGPNRSTFTNEKPAPYAAFNSITNNPLHGDERNFTQCRDKESGTWSTGLQVDNGHVYQCYIWFENAAAPNIAKDNPSAWLHDARARISFSRSPASQSTSVVGILSAANSRTVWSSCQFISNEKVSLSYVKGTAGIQRVPYDEDFRPAGDTIANSGGIRLGGEKFDGVIRQDVGYVLFDVKATLE